MIEADVEAFGSDVDEEMFHEMLMRVCADAGADSAHVKVYGIKSETRKFE